MSVDFRNYKFKKSIKGYNTEAVDDYIKELLEAYDSVLSENAELTHRNDILTKTLSDAKADLESAKKTISRRDKIINKAKDDAERIVKKAERDSEEMLRLAREDRVRLIEEGEAEKVKSDILSKKLLRATKLNCVKQLDEAKARVKVIDEEYERVRVSAANFKNALFEAYSRQILDIENIEIPRIDEIDKDLLYQRVGDVSVTEKTISDDIGDADAFVKESDVGTDIAANITTDTNMAPPTDDSVEVLTEEPSVAASDAYEKSEDSVPEAETASESVLTQAPDVVGREAHYQQEAEDIDLCAHEDFVGASGDRSRFTGFDVSVEYSGQVMYDITSYGSVKCKLLDIASEREEELLRKEKEILQKKQKYNYI